LSKEVKIYKDNSFDPFLYNWTISLHIYIVYTYIYLQFISIDFV
jgi:hypothetical protein